jgi:hypothetical protein
MSKKTEADEKERWGKVFARAKDRFEICVRWEGNARSHFVSDLKFAEADAYNMYQWPNQLYQDRQTSAKPCLTINRTRQHNFMIINDAKQNKPGVAIRPTGNGATYQAAQMLEGLVRHIEYQSNAQDAYDKATEFQVKGGVGYLRVTTDYVGSESFDQEIYIRKINDPLTIYLDPDAQEDDRLDSRFGFIFSDVLRTDWDGKYPEYKEFKDKGSASALGCDGNWFTEDRIRVAEYFEKTEKQDTLVMFLNTQTKQFQNMLLSDLKLLIKDDEQRKLILDAPDTKTRTVSKNTVMWYFIIGGVVVDEKEWPGKYIPILPVIGEECIIDGTMDRKGHTRAMIDPQRIYNYWTSAAVEHVALQNKIPYIAPAKAIEGYETFWNNANTENYSVLPYNHVDDEGQSLAAPIRQEAPQMAQGYIQGMIVAKEEMMMVSGQYQNQMGEPGNERTGKAIQERQRQGDTATYHFIDNLGKAIRGLGKVLLDLIPKIYDTQRVISIFAEDGTDFEIMIDPTAQQAFKIEQMSNQQTAQKVLNPAVGQYEVHADVGPAYSTRRQEAFNAFTQIITQAPYVAQIIGDLLLKAGDFPMANEAAERLRRMVPPQALGTGPSQQEEMLTAQLQNYQGLLAKALEELAAEKLRGKDKSAEAITDTYKAETDRMKVLLKDLNMNDLNGVITQLVGDAMNTHIQQAMERGQMPSPQMELPLGGEQTPPDGQLVGPGPGF